MCGKRLYDWKTIPIRRRTAFTSRGRVMSTPSRWIRPESIGSSRLTQRRSVDLPEPDAPISATTSCSPTLRSIPFSTVCLPNDFDEPLDDEYVAHPASLPACRMRRSRATSQSVKRASGIVSATNSTAADRYAVKLNVALVSICDWLNASTAPRVATSGAVLLQPDEVVEQRRDHPPHRLRKDDAPRASASAKVPSERAAASWLGCTDSMPARYTSRDVRAVDQDERDDPPEGRRRRDVLQRQGGRAEAEHRDHEDRREPAEDVRVDDHERANREEHRSGQAAQHRQEKREDEDEDLGDAEDLHVQQERAGDLRERRLELRPAEERLPHLGPARGVRDDVPDDREEDDGAQQRDRHAPAAVAAGAQGVEYA